MRIMRPTIAERMAGALLAVVVGVAGALVLWLVMPRDARSAPIFDCVDIASQAGAAADFRDAGADLEKTVRIARLRNAFRTSAEMNVIEREVRRVWREQLPRKHAVANLYKRCRRGLGDMGTES